VYSEPTILPLNADGLYALEDEQGRIIGTGTREICEALLTIMKNEMFNVGPLKSNQSVLTAKDRNRLPTASSPVARVKTTSC